MTARAAGAARPRTPGATAGSQSVLTGQWRLIDRCHCVELDGWDLIADRLDDEVSLCPGCDWPGTAHVAAGLAWVARYRQA
jgi:hypothetical protein